MTPENPGRDHPGPDDPGPDDRKDRRRFGVVEGGRPDQAQISQDDEAALAALADVLAGAATDPATAARARRGARDIMGLPEDTSTGLRPTDGPPAG